MRPWTICFRSLLTRLAIWEFENCMNKVAECKWLRLVYFESSRCKAAKVSKKMFQKKYCVIGAVLMYCILLLLFFVGIKSQRDLQSACSEINPCVRFCCENQTTCSEKFIRENFNTSLLTQSADPIEFKILLGKPSCSMKFVSNTSDEPWLLDKVRVETW